MEGGANVISEAVVAGLPVIASDIDGTKGLLGLKYPGYYPAGDTLRLRHQLRKAEDNIHFLERLRQHGAARAPLFTPQRETGGWKTLLDSFA
jgi:glycosyltransferase involved in cell wall biosynthesis